MPVGAEAKRAKTARGRRALTKREPKIVEDPRTTLIMRGQRTSDMVNRALTDLFMLKKPHALHFRRHNAVHPFEDINGLEFMCDKNDASLFVFGTHSKKRPHNLVFGRLFDHHLLDMTEFGIDAFRPMQDYPEAGGGHSLEAKPCLLFQGADWEHRADLQSLRSLFTDFFQLREVDVIAALGVEHVIALTAYVVDDKPKVLLRHYSTKLKKSREGGAAPYVQLLEMGPSVDLSLRRVHYASDDLMKAAMQKPKAHAGKPKKVKNIAHDKLAGRTGRLHMPKQDLSQLSTARFKATRRPSKGVKRNREEEADGE